MTWAIGGQGACPGQKACCSEASWATGQLQQAPSEARRRRRGRPTPGRSDRGRASEAEGPKPSEAPSSARRPTRRPTSSRTPSRTRPVRAPDTRARAPERMRLVGPGLLVVHLCGLGRRRRQRCCSVGHAWRQQRCSRRGDGACGRGWRKATLPHPPAAHPKAIPKRPQVMIDPKSDPN